MRRNRRAFRGLRNVSRTIADLPMPFREVARMESKAPTPSKVTGSAAPVRKCCDAAMRSALPRGRGSAGVRTFHGVLRAKEAHGDTPSKTRQCRAGESACPTIEDTPQAIDDKKSPSRRVFLRFCGPKAPWEHSLAVAVRMISRRIRYDYWRSVRALQSEAKPCLSHVFFRYFWRPRSGSQLRL